MTEPNHIDGRPWARSDRQAGFLLDADVGRDLDREGHLLVERAAKAPGFGIVPVLAAEVLEHSEETIIDVVASFAIRQAINTNQEVAHTFSFVSRLLSVDCACDHVRGRPRPPPAASSPSVIADKALGDHMQGLGSDLLMSFDPVRSLSSLTFH
jgi:hypothetical protein